MQTIVQRLLHHHQNNPDAVCVHLLQTGQAPLLITYRSLAQEAAGYAQKLQEAGVRPGDVIPLILPHGSALLAAFFGVSLVGAVPSILPYSTEKIGPAYYKQNLSALLQHIKPAAVITTSPRADDIIRYGLLATHFSGELLLADQIDGPQNEADPADWLAIKTNPAEIALLQHSSGTTGLQKGVALSHRAVFNQLAAYSMAIDLAPESDVVVSWLPLYHDMGLLTGFLLPVLTGTPLVLMSPFDWVRSPKILLQAVSEYGGTLSWLPNFAFNFCAQKIRPVDLEGVNLSSWRAVINCSEPTYLSSHRMFFDRFQSVGLRWEALAVCYAMAENVFAVTQSQLSSTLTVDAVDRASFLQQKIAIPAAKSNALTFLSAGKPIAGTQLRIVGPKGRSLPERHVGEIAIRSSCLLSEYYRRPDVTKAAFHEDWYLTGDYGYLADGQLYVVGRKKDVIIVGGKNIYPQDLEALVSTIDGIHEGRVVCFGVFNPALGTEDVVVVAEIRAGKMTETQPVKEEIRHLIASATEVVVRPNLIKLVEAGWIIKTSSGKVARHANREKYLYELECSLLSTNMSTA